MVGIADILTLASPAIGVLGAVLLFMELFQLPSYVRFEPEFEQYNVTVSPPEADEYTWFGRTGALLLAIAFALQFVTALLP